ncbi:MAG: hypothetical protein Ct9H90mP16_02530 [Candidatus Poseidoniales archaeon]|nr:MAG: hypothetical protein Ct9H90mP16_02530 [Candidatus Poseidoniales archaeon]
MIVSIIAKAEKINVHSKMADSTIISINVKAVIAWKEITAMENSVHRMVLIFHPLHRN